MPKSVWIDHGQVETIGRLPAPETRKDGLIQYAGTFMSNRAARTNNMRIFLCKLCSGKRFEKLEDLIRSPR